MMQPHVTTDAKRNKQELGIALVAMVNHEPTCRSTRATLEPVAFKNQIAQAAEPAQRIWLTTKPNSSF